MGSALIDCLSFVWLVPVVRGGPAVHYLRRDGNALGVTGPSLCGELGDLDRHNVPKWRRVKVARSKVCGACHAAACAEPTRIDWSGGPS